MLKMIKYEYKRALHTLGLVFGILIGLEILFVVSALINWESMMTIALAIISMIVFCGYIFILGVGIRTYSDDLKKKEGYLVFMTPVSSYGIIGAKLISTLLAGVSFVILAIVAQKINFGILGTKYNMPSVSDMFTQIIVAMGADAESTMFSIFVLFLLVLVEFYMIITMAYFSISLSATILQNKKGKGIISAIIFVLIYILVTIISYIIRPNDSGIIDVWISMIFYFIVVLLCYVGSAYLLDKKISL